VRLYRAHLKPGGVLALHASNVHLAVPAVARGVIEDAGGVAMRVCSTGDKRYDGSSSDWILASDHAGFMQDYDMRVAATPWTGRDRDPILWTDDFSSLWSVRTSGNPPGKWEAAPNSGQFVVDFAQLVTYEDRKRIEEISRRLYADSEGNMGLIVMTLKHQARAGLAYQDLATTGEGVYHAIGLGKGARDMGLLVLVAQQEQKVNLQLGPDWPEEIRQPLLDILRATLSPGLRGGHPSRSLRRTIEQMDTLIRERAATAAN
jgi:hypothetical protein